MIATAAHEDVEAGLTHTPDLGDLALVEHTQDRAFVAMFAQMIIQVGNLGDNLSFGFAIIFGEQDRRRVTFDKVDLFRPLRLETRQVEQLFVEQFRGCRFRLQNGRDRRAGFDHPVKVDHREAGAGRFRDQPQSYSGQHSQRTFAAGEQLGQVEAFNARRVAHRRAEAGVKAEFIALAWGHQRCGQAVQVVAGSAAPMFGPTCQNFRRNALDQLRNFAIDACFQ